MVGTAHADALTGKGVLVVGASRGIGEGVCTALLNAAARVLAAGRDRGRSSALTARLSVDAHSLLLTREIDVNQLFEREYAVSSRVTDLPIDMIGNWEPPGRRDVLTSLTRCIGQ